MNRKITYRRWLSGSDSAGKTPPNTEETVADGDFELPRGAMPISVDLRPGEKFRFSVCWEMPFDETPGSRLYVRMKSLMPEIDGDGWGTLTDEMRARFEKMARDKDPIE